MSFDLFAFIDISKHYSQKATIEHELPTATQKLITTNDCILSSVVALTSGAGKVIFLWFILALNSILKCAPFPLTPLNDIGKLICEGFWNIRPFRKIKLSPFSFSLLSI